MIESPTDFFQRNGIAMRVSGKEIEIDCPKCGKDKHCRVNSTTWLWHCKRCDSRGNERSLKVALGLQIDVSSATEKSIERIEEERLARAIATARPRSDIERWRDDLQNRSEASTARDYLLTRGIPLEIARKYFIGWCASPDGSTPRSSRRRIEGAEEISVGSGWLVIPSLTKPGDPSSAALVKLRSVPPSERAFRRLCGGNSVLFAPNGIDHNQTLLIVGGEIDALSCIIAGWTNVISSTVGEKGWKLEATAQLEKCEDIVIAYDNDAAGKEGAENLVEILGRHRCRIGVWPANCKDANESLCKLSEKFDIEAIVNASRSTGQDGIIRVADIREQYLEELRNGKPRGISSGWTDLDRLIGGIRSGEVTLVTGDTASGKSTFVSQLALNMAKSGQKVLFCPFELGAKRQVAKFVRQSAGAAPDILSDKQINDTLDTLDELPLMLLRRYGGISRESLRNTLLYCIRRLGVQFVVLDHIHFMVSEGPDERVEIDAMMKLIAEIAVDFRIHIVVVAHPRQHQASSEKDRDNRIIQASDLKGSAGLKQLSDNIWSIWRPRKADRSTAKIDDNTAAAVLYALKNRDDYGSEGSVAFRFDLASATFSEPSSTMANPVVDLSRILPAEPQENRPRRVRVSKIPPVQIRAERHWTETDKDSE